MKTESRSSSIGAFFDFDETLLETESSRLGFKYLWERRLVSLGFIAKVLVANFFYKRHWISDETIAAIMLKFYRNKRLEEFQQGAAAFYQEHLKPHLAPNLVDRVAQHHRSGHVLVLISGSIRYLLEPVAEDLRALYQAADRSVPPAALDEAIKQAAREVLERQLDFNRLSRSLARMAQANLKMIETQQLTPLAFPIMVNRLRARVSSEILADRVKRMQLKLERKASA